MHTRICIYCYKDYIKYKDANQIEFLILIPLQEIFKRTANNRALDKREYLVIIRDIFCQFYCKTYFVTPHLNRLDETVQMRGHNIWFL